MGKSYKKTPIMKDGGSSSKWAKKQANKRVRRFKGDISSGKQYRKIYNPWDINDSVSRHSIYDWMKEFERFQCEKLYGFDKWGFVRNYVRIEKYYTYNWWAKYYLRK